MKRKALGILLAVLMVAMVFVLTSCDDLIGGGETESPHEHNFENWEVTREATCKSEGEMIGECDCGEKNTTIIPQRNHVLSDWIVSESPTCSVPGLKQRICVYCEKVLDKEELPTTDHTVVKEPGTNATCTENGHSEWSYCVTCGTTIEEKEIIPATGHSYVDAVTQPTCTEGGYTTHTCHCGDICIDSITEAIGHNEVLDTATDPTCTNVGLTEGSHCDRCGEVLVAQETIPAVGHNYESTVIIPTCTEKGYTLHTCVCGDTYKDSYVDALGHTEVIDEAVPATCTLSGKTEGKHCSVCDTIIVKQKVIPTKGHTPGEWQYDVEPTCTTQGSKYRECTVCFVTIDNRLVPENGHTIVTLPSISVTCTENGLTEGSYCSVCEVTLIAQVAVPATGHNYISVVTSPTCTEGGYTTHICKCGDTYIDSYVDALGHNEVVDEEISPTCTKTGLTEGSHCSACGKVFVEQTAIDATGHNYHAITTEPTCTKLGYTTNICDSCGKSYANGYVSAIGHNWGEWETNGTETIRRCINECNCGEQQRVTRVEVTYNGPVLFTGDTVSKSDLRVVATISDNTSFEVADFTIENDVMTVDGTNTVVIKVGSFSVNVSITAVLENLPGTTDISEFTYTTSNGAITITKFTGSSTDVVIPAHVNKVSVRYIAYSAFENCTTIKSVIIPESIQWIGTYAFRGCSGLESVTFNEGLKTIYGGAFYGCPITSLVIPNSVTTINTYNEGSSAYPDYRGAFENCDKLKNIIIGDGLTSIAIDTFRDCALLNSVIIGNSVSSIDNYAFYNCDSLTDVDMGISVNTICIYAFADCNALKHVDIGEAVNVIGSSAFENCNALESINISSSVEKINSRAFLNCTSLANIVIPSNVQLIGLYAFNGCSGLTSVTFNEGLKTIEGGAFYGCPITSLVIPDSVTTINTYNEGSSAYPDYRGAFENCTQLKSVVIGSGLSTISRETFDQCWSLVDVDMGGVITIELRAFCNCDALENLRIGESVLEIGEEAFYDCGALTNVTMSNSVKYIQMGAFRSCTALKNVTIGSSVVKIDTYAFKSCTSLEFIEIPSSVQWIGYYAFDGCSGLTSVKLNEGLKTIYGGAFYGCALTELVIPDSVTAINTYNEGTSSYPDYRGAFENCTQLKSVVIGSGLSTISRETFRGCASLTNITIPENINTIGDYAFADCKKLEYIVIEGTTLKTIGKYVTSSCNSIRRIYYKGTIADWNTISINSANVAPFNQIPYIYSESQPTSEGNYWHYSESGEPIVWDITLSEYTVYALANAYTGTMGSSMLSCSSFYLNEMKNDTAFMREKNFYETLVLVADLGSALDNQMSKEQLYMIVLLDVLGYNYSDPSETPELATCVLKYGAFAYSYINTASEVIDVEAFKELFPYLDNIDTFLKVFGDMANASNDNNIAKKNLLGFALQCQGSIDALTRIANDTSTDKNLRNAANNVIEIINRAFDGTLKDLINENTNIQITKTLTNMAIGNVWDQVLKLIPYYGIAQCVAKGIKITLDIFCKTDISIDAYYKLQVTEVIENALRKQINSLSGDYLRRENLNKSATLCAVINLYSSSISKGYEYTMEYLDEVGKDDDYIYESYVANTRAFKQFEAEIESKYYSLYGY